MEFNCEIRTGCSKLLKLIANKDASEGGKSVNGIIRQLKQDCNYITEEEVKRSIEGIQHKFDIHAERGKSRHFKQLVTRYIQLTVPNGLTHSTWSILHLLIRLAYRPTEKSYPRADGCVLRNLNIDTQKYASKHLEHAEIQEVCVKEMAQSASETVMVPWTDSEEDDVVCSKSYEIVDDKAYVTTYSIPTFAKSKQCSNLNFSLSELCQETYDKDSTSKIWTEYQVLHEILWTLHQSCENDDSSVAPRKCLDQSKVPNVDGLPCLSVKCFHPLMQSLAEINLFLNNTTSQEYTLTYQAYAVALNGIVMKFNQSVSNYEKLVAQQNATITISHLYLYLKPWTFNITTIAEMHKTIMQMPSSMTDNNSRVIHLLSVLYDSAEKAQVAKYASLYPILLHILFSSLEPFLNMVDLWLNRGIIVDPYMEFGILQNEAISPIDERSWSELFMSCPCQPSISFLKPLMDDILLGGRSVELLTQLSKHSINVNGDCRSGTLMHTVRNCFNGFAPDNSSCGKHVFHSPDVIVTTKKHPNQKFRNPLLAKAFKTFRNHFCQRKQTEDKPNQVEEVCTPLEFFPLSPLLERSLLEPLRIRQRLACKSLLDTLYEDCCLKLHILTIRRIHLMQAGDLMGRFCLQLFQKIESGEKWDNESSLTLSLLNCISPRMGQCGSYFSVTVKRGSNQEKAALLVDLQINYKAPWPINLVITQDSMSFYNSVFRFLVQIKQGMFTLQHLSFKDLNSMDAGFGSRPGQQELLPATRRHRLQLLRAWLLYFISSVDNYIMECVLESSHVRLEMQLQNAVHFGQIIDSHQQYLTSIHKQCLQQPSGAFLRDAINEVLLISRKVTVAWKHGIDQEMLNKLEENYVRHHQFVAAVLGTDSAHSMLPHVETLAAALIHSCPTTR